MLNVNYFVHIAHLGVSQALSGLPVQLYPPHLHHPGQKDPSKEDSLEDFKAWRKYYRNDKLLSFLILCARSPS